MIENLKESPIACAILATLIISLIPYYVLKIVFDSKENKKKSLLYQKML